MSENPEANRGTDEQILTERKLTCEAIDGAMAFGYQNTNPPPSDDHWLAPYWKIGRKQAELEVALSGPAEAQPVAVAELPSFPTMLRKMWSGGEVQRWIDDNIKPLMQEQHHDFHVAEPVSVAPEGWRVVPEHVTDNMIDAANNTPSGIAGSPPHWQHVWDCMLDAAPAAPQAPAVSAVDRTPPFSNCRFRECDLPGQCRSEGKCHHPVTTAPARSEQESDRDAYYRGWNAAIAAFSPVNAPYPTARAEGGEAVAWRMVCGDWRDETVALHGPRGHIVSGLTAEQAKAIITAHGGRTAIAAVRDAQADFNPRGSCPNGAPCEIGCDKNEPCAAQADQDSIPDECAASGASCSYRPHGMNGEMQCQYCGKEQR
jgi:hypothetical protein